jgi:hypothetical protein
MGSEKARTTGLNGDRSPPDRCVLVVCMVWCGRLMTFLGASGRLENSIFESSAEVSFMISM